MLNHGFLRVAAASPKLEVANPRYNATEICSLMVRAQSAKASVLVLPELCVTAYTCGDLFGHGRLLESALSALHEILLASEGTDLLTILGIPLRVKQRLYNSAVVVLNGRILGAVPKTFIPNYKEFYEQRWFESGSEVMGTDAFVEILGQTVPFGSLVFDCVNHDMLFTLGIEICEDLWAPIPPSSILALHGASIIVNPSASNELVAKSEYREQLVLQQSARCISAYIYASSGVYESTTDLVFGGDCIIAENGTALSRGQRFSRENELIVTEIDVDRLQTERQQNKSFFAHKSQIAAYGPRHVEFAYRDVVELSELHRSIHPLPFVPSWEATRAKRCEEIFSIQTAGLAKRLEHTGQKHAAIAVSGGLDSTLALLVVAKTFDILRLPRENILAVTMPGFATTKRTYTNALALIHGLGATMQEIDIKPACLQHFLDIGHDSAVHDVTYENTQARERTQIIMDLANKIGGLAIGTGDLSELALGWCTYNGDHMSMYSVNTGVPKTLVKYLVSWVAESGDLGIRTVLREIIDTPVSPELIPGQEPGTIGQITEDLIGPYELHDFFLYYFVRHGMTPRKILFLARQAFRGKYTQETVQKWLTVFLRRFFSQQFKRSCLPDGPKVGSVSLSPRGDWRMPSDASARAWLTDLD